MHKIFIIFMLCIFPFLSIVGQDFRSNNNTNLKFKKRTSQMASGDLLETIQLIPEHNPKGVTVANDKIVISSRDETGNNYFDTYSFDGTHLESVSLDRYDVGYRDLAFDGTYILASASSYINKLDPEDFSVVERIYNEKHIAHNGLAYDPENNVIYSTYYNNDPMVKINATTGETIKEYTKPDDYNHYGIAFDNYSQPGISSIWFNLRFFDYETFRLARVDTSTGRFNFLYDFTEHVDDSSTAGGLEIIDDHPDYPGKTVALAVDRYNKKIILADLSDTPFIIPGKISKQGEFAGWENGEKILSGLVQYDDYLYAVDKSNDKLIIYSLTPDPANPVISNSIDINDPNKIFLHNNYLFVTYHTFDATKFKIFDISDPLNPIEKGNLDTGEPILEMVFAGNYAYLIQNNVDQILVYDISDISSPLQAATYNLMDNATDLEINTNIDVLLAGYYGGVSTGFEAINISDPLALEQLDSHPTNGDYPKRLKFIDNENIATLLNDLNWMESWLVIYGFSDHNNIDYLDLDFASSDTTASDMKILNETIAITVPGEGLKTFQWLADVYEPGYGSDYGIIFDGPQYGFDKGLEFVGYNISNSNYQNSLNKAPTQMGAASKQDLSFLCGKFFLYVLRGIGFGTNVDGSEKGVILKLEWPCSKVNLTTAIEPPEAAEAGCSVTKTPDLNQYEVGSVVSVSAAAADQWKFVNWTGGLSGATNPQNITMDSDKFVTAVFEQLPPEKRSLTVSINPPEAADNGCSTVPEPGTHEYDLNTELNVHAVPNQESGWYFKEWTGDASGSDLSAHLIMDDNKDVTANFVELELTVSGHIDKETYCPSYIEGAYLDEGLMLVVGLCASEDDGWNVTSIEFSGSGTGSEIEDINLVSLVSPGGSIIGVGTFSGDNGTFTVTFAEPISIDPGDCYTFGVVYEFDIDEDTYARDEVKTFDLETKAVNGSPWNYDEGEIVGSADRDPLTIGRVINSDDWAFSKIQNAVDSYKTDDGDTCYVCPGTYTENVEVKNIDNKKSVVITSYDGPDETIVEPADETKPVFDIYWEDNFEISGFTIIGSEEENTATVEIGRGNNFKISNNKIFSARQGLQMVNAENSIVENNLFTGNDSYPSEQNVLYLYKAHRNQLINNTFDVNLIDDYAISLETSFENEIAGNSASGQYLNILVAKNSVKNDIYFNEGNGSDIERYSKMVLDDATNNFIGSNKYFQIQLNNSMLPKILKRITRKKFYCWLAVFVKNFVVLLA